MVDWTWNHARPPDQSGQFLGEKGTPEPKNLFKASSLFWVCLLDAHLLTSHFSAGPDTLVLPSSKNSGREGEGWKKRDRGRRVWKGSTNIVG